MTRDQQEAHLRLMGWWPGFTKAGGHYAWTKEGVGVIGFSTMREQVFILPAHQATCTHPSDGLVLSDQRFGLMFEKIMFREGY